MAKELTLVQSDDASGYIVKTIDPQAGVVHLKVRTNFGAAVKDARAFFGEVKQEKKEETE